jgi:uncharacterized repeat protein (TIGR01451 family)
MIKTNQGKPNNKILTKKNLVYTTLWTTLLLASPIFTDKALAGLVQVNKSFSVPSISQGDTSILTISIFNSSTQILTNVGLTDNAPSQIKILPAGVTGNSCGGTVTAVPGTSTIILSGGTVPAVSGFTPGSCTINVAVTATAGGNWINTIDANALTNTQLQTNDSPSSATLQTTALTTATVANAWSPTTVAGGQTGTYTITLNNPNVGKSLAGAQISQTFPAALAIQTGSVATSCGGTVNVSGQQVTLTGGTIPAAPNSSTPGTCTVTVPVSSFTTGAYPLSIPANALITTSGVSNTAASSTTTLNVQGGVGVAKTFTGTLRENSTIPVNVTITNNNGVPLTGVGITDNLPNPGLIYSSLSSNSCGGTITPSGTPLGSIVTLAGGAIPANGSCTFTFNALTDRTQGTVVTNTIPANSLVNNLNQTNGSAVTANTTVQRALNVTKTFSTTPITPGGNSTLTINIQNNSTSSGTVNLTDNLPTVVSNAGPPARPAGNILVGTGTSTANANCGSPTITAVAGTATVTITGATIPAGATCSVTVPITSDARANAYTNTIPTANVTSPQGLTTANATAPITVTNPLTFAKTFLTTPVNPGFPSQLRVRVTNSSALDATNLRVTDPLPTSLVIATPTNVTSTNCGTPNFSAVTAGGTSFNVTGVTVPAGQICDLFVDVKSDLANTYNNNIPINNIFSSEGWSNSAAVTGSLVVNRPFTVSSTFKNPPQTNPDTTNVTIDAGQVAKIRFDITNISATSRSSVSFADTLPAGVTTASSVNPVFGPGCGGTPATTTAANSGTVNFSGVTIAAGATCTLTVDVTSLVPNAGYNNGINANSVTHAPSGTNTNLAPSPNNSTNRLVVTSPFQGTGRAGADPNASGTGTLIPSPSKSFSPSPIVQNSGISTLTINIPNGAAVSATNVGLTDTFPAGLVVASTPNASATNCGTPTFNPVAAANSVVLSGATIAPGATCVLKVDVISTASGTLTNTINAISSTQNFPFTAISAPINVVNSNVIVVGKSFNTPNLVPGQTRNLILTIQNNNLTTAATGVTITDNLGAANLKTPNNTVTPTFSTACSGFTPTSIPANSTSITFSGGTVAANNTCTITLPNGVTSLVPSATPYTNTIAADGADFTSSLGKDTQPRSATMTVNPAFTVTKSFNNAGVTNQTIAAGNTATIRINIFKANAGTTPATGVSITDALPANLVLASSTATFSNSCGTGPAPTFTGTAGTGTFTASNIRIANNATCTIDATVTSAVPGTYGNTIPAANFSSTNVGGILAPVTSSNNLIVTSPLVSSKSFIPTPVSAGSPSTLRINIQNTSSTIDVTGVGVTDSLPTTPANLVVADTPNVSSSNCGTPTIAATAGSQTITVTGATVLKNTTCTVNVDVKANSVGSYANTIPAINVTSAQGFNAQGAANATLVTSSGLTIAKDFQPAIVNPGTPVRLTVTLTNASPFPLTNAAVTDSLNSNTVVANPANAITNCVGGTVTATPNANSISLSGATIPSQVSGIAGTCTFSANVIKSDVGTFNNDIPVNAVTTTQGVRNTNAATATLTTTPLSVEIVKQILPVNIDGGDPSTLSLTVTNNNNVALSNVNFVDTMPTGMIIFSPSQATTTCTNGIVTAIPNDGKFTFSGATIPANSNCSITVKITSSRAGTLTNTIAIGQVNSDQGAKNSLATSASLTALPAVVVTKDFTPPTIKPGGIGKLTVTLVNTNSIPLNGVAFIDPLPVGPPAMVIAPTPNASTTCGGGTITAVAGSGTLSLSGGSIPSSGQCVVTVDITSSGVGQITNTIAAEAVKTTEGATNKNPGSRVFNILNPPVISKVFSPVSIAPGGVSTLTLTVSNSNPSPFNLTSVALTDNLPSGVTVATPANASTTCGGTLNAVAGNNTVSILGATIPANNSCTITLNVTSVTIGTVTNTIPANSITTAEQTTNENPATAPLTVANPSNPKLLLVKRITKINGLTTANSTSGGTINLTNVLDDLTDPNDNDPAWPSNFLQGAFEKVSIKPSDEIEYTIYFIASGTTLANVSICDLVPPNTTFNQNSFANAQGIILQLGNIASIQTNATDGDNSRFISSGVSAPGLCRNPPDVSQPLSSAQNVKGAVLVDVVQGTARLPESAPGSPNYGLIRFRVKVD